MSENSVQEKCSIATEKHLGLTSDLPSLVSYVVLDGF